MTYYHNVQQTQNSGLDREMRLAADPEFVYFDRRRKSGFHREMAYACDKEHIPLIRKIINNKKETTHWKM